MAERQSKPAINTNMNRTLVSSQMQQANMQSAWREPDYGSVLKMAAAGAQKYLEAEKEAAYKRFDLDASRMQLQEMEKIRLAGSNAEIPQIEKQFNSDIANAFANETWGKQWMKDRGETFLKLNSNDVIRASFAKQKELATLEMDKTINTWANDISEAGADKAKAMIGNMTGYIDASQVLTPAEKQKTKDNAYSLILQRTISSNPAGALSMLNDADYKWSEKGIEVEKYQQAALASVKNAGQQRLIKQINDNRQAATELINKSMNEGLSLDDIDKSVSDESADLKKFLYSINGYATDGDAVKLSNAEKSKRAFEIYNTGALLRSNSNTSIEDWQNYEKMIYQGMNEKSITISEGNSLLNDIATPYMETYQNNTEQYDNSAWGGDKVGYGEINNYIDNVLLNNDLDEDDFSGNKKIYENFVAQNNRTRVAVYKTYNDELLKSIAAYNAEHPNYNITIANLNNQLDSVKGEIYKRATDNTKLVYNQQNYERLKNLKPEEQPGAVLDSGGLVNNSDNVENSTQGTPVSGLPYIGIAKKGPYHYGLLPDGKTAKRITYSEYMKYGGK